MKAKARPEGNSLHSGQAALTFLWIHNLKDNILSEKHNLMKQKQSKHIFPEITTVDVILYIHILKSTT